MSFGRTRFISAAGKGARPSAGAVKPRRCLAPRFISQNQFEQKWNNKLLRRTWSITTMRPAFRNLPQICQRWWIETFLPPFSVCSFLKMRCFFSRRSGKDRNLWGSQNPNTVLLSLLRFLVFLEVEVEKHPYHPWEWYICLHLPLKKLTIHVGNYTGLMDPVDELTPGIPSWARGPSCHRSSFWPGAVAVSQDGRYDLVSHRIHGTNGLFTYMNG